jgi:O-acetyl-ADP-ribose deacetylase (regulator of RNase III)/transcriptional regulator with XRE-family HTH domain
MPLRLVAQNIVTMDVDAIVNAANSGLRMGGGVCGAIFSAAGPSELQKECETIGFCQTGQAVITKGYALRARHIIHTVGPVWYGGQKGEKAHLQGCYRNSLKLAAANGCKSVAFPLISSGIFGYPKDLALKEAMETIAEYLREHDEMEVFLVLFGSFKEFAPKKLQEIPFVLEEKKTGWPPFKVILLELIEAKKLETEVLASSSNLTRAALKDILSGNIPNPPTNTVLALSIALGLKPSKALELLAASENSIEEDLSWKVVANFLENGPVDIHQVNLALFALECPPL